MKKKVKFTVVLCAINLFFVFGVISNIIYFADYNNLKFWDCIFIATFSNPIFICLLVLGEIYTRYFYEFIKNDMKIKKNDNTLENHIFNIKDTPEMIIFRLGDIVNSPSLMLIVMILILGQLTSIFELTYLHIFLLLLLAKVYFAVFVLNSFTGYKEYENGLKIDREMENGHSLAKYS